jgi:hypothetical protein
MMKRYKSLDPSAPTTRAEVFIEILDMWEESLAIIANNPSGSVEEAGTKAEIEAAIYVLKRTFPVSELMSLDAYDYVKDVANKVEFTKQIYDKRCKVIEESTVLSPEMKEQQLAELSNWYDSVLSRYDRSDDDASQ